MSGDESGVTRHRVRLVVVVIVGDIVSVAASQRHTGKRCGVEADTVILPENRRVGVEGEAGRTALRLLFIQINLLLRPLTLGIQGGIGNFGIARAKRLRKALGIIGCVNQVGRGGRRALREQRVCRAMGIGLFSLQPGIHAETLEWSEHGIQIHHMRIQIDIDGAGQPVVVERADGRGSDDLHVAIAGKRTEEVAERPVDLVIHMAVHVEGVVEGVVVVILVDRDRLAGAGVQIDRGIRTGGVVAEMLVTEFITQVNLADVIFGAQFDNVCVLVDAFGGRVNLAGVGALRDAAPFQQGRVAVTELVLVPDGHFREAGQCQPGFEEDIPNIKPQILVQLER